MEIIKKIFVTILCLSYAVVFTSGVNSTQPDNKIVRKADNLFIFGDYKNALPIYEKLAAANPENKQFNYRLGVCYYYSGTDVLKCLPYFEKAKKVFKEEDEETIDLYYYLGTTYHMINRFDEAIECYTKIKASILPDKQGLEDIRDMDNQIAACMHGKELIQHPVSVVISNLGPNVNSEYADYAPVITNDQSVLIFTSKRKESTGGRIDEDGNYYEDVFISKRMKAGEWQSSERLDTTGNIKRNFFSFSKSKVLGNSINTREHDASVALSPDGKQLFIYRLDDVWVSDYKDDKWNKPSKLNNFISSKKSHEPSVSMSMDEKTLYFVSERKGGYGGKDIYRSEKQSDGSWGEPQNLGPVINSEYDEDAPYIDSQNNTLYFSSEAHGSIGGFDVFKSTVKDGVWTEPENLGYPVNSGANDIFFAYNSTEKTAYFASLREGGNGNYDIYLADFNPPAERNTIVKTPLAVIQNNKLKTDPTEIEVLSANGQPDTLRADQNNNLMYKPGEKYSMAITSPASGQKHITEFTVPGNARNTHYYQEVSFDEIRDAKGKVTGYKTSLYNAGFDLDSAIKNTEYAKITDKALAYAAYLKAIKNANNPALQVFEYEDKITADGHGVIVKNNGTEMKLNPVLFGYAQDNFTPEFIPELEKAYGYMANDKTLTMKVTGYTDSRGNDKYNQSLSERRASTVKKYFVTKGITASRIKSSGKGESDPVAAETNPDGSDNPEGRKQNRRVELLIEKQ